MGRGRKLVRLVRQRAMEAANCGGRSRGVSVWRRGAPAPYALTMDVIGGRCLCGGVRFELTLPFRRANHCHCSLCRRHSGSTGLLQGRVPRDRFRLLQGEDLIRVYRPAGGRSVKAFCSVCGSSLFGNQWPEGDEVSVRLSALDAGTVALDYHSWVGSKASWDQLPDDGLPRYDAGPPSS